MRDFDPRTAPVPYPASKVLQQPAASLLHAVLRPMGFEGLSRMSLVPNSLGAPVPTTYSALNSQTVASCAQNLIWHVCCEVESVRAQVGNSNPSRLQPNASCAVSCYLAPHLCVVHAKAEPQLHPKVSPHAGEFTFLGRSPCGSFKKYRGLNIVTNIYPAIVGLLL